MAQIHEAGAGRSGSGFEARSHSAVIEHQGWGGHRCGRAGTVLFEDMDFLPPVPTTGELDLQSPKPERRINGLEKETTPESAPKPPGQGADSARPQNDPPPEKPKG